MKIAVITDTHLVAPGGTVGGIDAYGAYMREEIGRWAEVIRANGIRVE